MVDTSKQITDFKAAPDTAGLVEVLSAASLVFIWAATPFADTSVLSDVSAAISERVQQFVTLPGAFRREAADA